jgi:flagellar assembly protein FliH
MTSSSPEVRFTEAFPRTPALTPAAGFAAARPVQLPAPARPAQPVVRDEHAGTVVVARFDVDLREQPTLPGEIGARLRAEAESAGYANGWAKGRREADLAARAARDQVEAEVRQANAVQAARMDQALTALTGAASGLERRMVPVAAELADIVVATAYALAETIIGRELTLAVEPGRDAVARALAYARADLPVTVRLHPSDYATVTQRQPGTVEIEGRTVSITADATLRPGDAVAECDATTIDARIEPALDRVREVMGL